MPERLQYLDSEGNVLELSALPGVRALGDGGLDMPPLAFVEDVIPGQAGAQLRDVRIAARDAVLPFYLEQDSDTAVRDLLRSLARRLNPQRGDGRLRHIATDGTTRDLTCRYTGGLEGARIRGSTGPNWRRGVLTFRAHDPFWYDATPMASTFTTGDTRNFLGDPFLPIKLTSDTVLGEQTVTNDGDVETWPVWTINGPGTSIVLTNVSTGEVIDLPITLTASQSVIVDTRPFRKTVRRDDGTNLFGSLTGTSSLWSLREGNTVINTQVAGSTTDTFVTLVYSRRFLSP
jgi:hypothetical protein